MATTHDAGCRADETTSLLTSSHSNDAKETTEVHYKNIDARRFYGLFSSVLVAYVLVYFDSFFMASSHPIITSYFNASNAASWLSTVFFLSSTISGPFYGRISDVTGRRTMYLFSLTVFAVTTAWCGLATSIGSFIAARFACGLGAGGVAAMSNIILSDIVKVQFRGIYQSYLNLCFGLGNAMGASLGGLLCERIGWRAAFLIQVPFIIALLLFAIWATPDPLGPSLAKAEGKSITAALATFDIYGALALTLSTSGLILGINLGGSVFKWTHPVVVSALIVFVIASVALVLVERRAERPLLPLHLLSTLPYANLNFGNTLGSMLSATANFNLPIYLQAVKQFSASKSGTLLLSPLIGISVTSVLVGFALARTGKPKIYLSAGVICQLAGMVACGLLRESNPTAGIIFMIPWVLVGQGFFFPASTVTTLSLCTSDDQAIVVTTLGLVRSLGNIFGTAFSSSVLQNTLVAFLQNDVTGKRSERDRIIAKVRKSIGAIRELDPKHKQQGSSPFIMLRIH